MPTSIHVISPVAGFGSSLDLSLVASILEQGGFAVSRYPVRRRGKKARYGEVAHHLLGFHGRFDVNIFLAPIFPEWLPLARKNILIPNVEGFKEELQRYLPRIDLVLAKTHLTEKAFAKLGCRTEFTSFTSRDHLDEKVPRNPATFFHACSSGFKGTQRLMETWMKHPDWPDLTVVINHNESIPLGLVAPNMRVLRKELPEEEYRRLQNSIPFHLCCSEAEGFGHYIMEALSCRAVTFTTNAAPMNELVTPERGLLVDPLPDPEPMELSHRYRFDPGSLEEKIEQARKFEATTIAQIGAAARAFFLENDRFFRQRLLDVIGSL